MSRRRRKFRASYDPGCADCTDGWRRVPIVNRFGSEVFSVTRCHCFKITRIPDDAPKKLPRLAAGDGKTAGAGGDR